MRTLAVGGRMGASGDMILGGLLAVGADRAVLNPIEDALDVRYEIGSTMKQGIDATSVEVHTTDGRRAETTDRKRGLVDDDGTKRTFTEVIDLLESMELDPAVETTATAVFRLLGEAEAAVHGVDLMTTHFHEVGTDDAIADVCGAIALLGDLRVDRVITEPLSTGGGEVKTSHGVYPVPPPAVVEIATRSSFRIRGGPIDAELLTPTGAAILGHVATGVDVLPCLAVESVGYGAGSRDHAEYPNVVRMVLGEEQPALVLEDISVLETNVDDVSPEVLGSLHETLISTGARDVSIVPLTMKKSRPGHLIRVVVRPEDELRIARRIAEETGSLGVRVGPSTHRWIASREIVTVEVTIGGVEYEIQVKVASDDDGTIFDISTEYDDAISVALDAGRPVKEVIQKAEEAAHEALEQ